MHLIAKPILPAGIGLGEVELVPSSGPNKTMQEVTIESRDDEENKYTNDNPFCQFS